MSVYQFAIKSSFIQNVGEDHFFDSKTMALSTLYQKLNKNTCQGCEAMIFKECSEEMMPIQSIE
ncbi:MAG: hypothetical protein COW84_09665 [Gammaproteobacteria bacterium CG22_combo_CG10-13_8_21_14_all_40_8]|nr:MAG: hypothetical protein COW84_09665 [Gammaproteobacteria bacterium CG22_combo_CG10-13_8_21_14_all_40_8]